MTRADEARAGSGALTLQLPLPMSLCDRRARMGLTGLFALLMDAATAHAEREGFGTRLLTERGLFWLTVHTCARISARPRMGEMLQVRTWIGTCEGAKSWRSTKVVSDDETVAEALTEYRAMNVRTGEMVRADRLMDAFGIAPGPDVFAPEKVRIDEAFGPETRVSTHVVRGTDIDIGNHMNNAAYVRAVEDGLDYAQVCDLTRLEMIYRRPAKEGEVLTLFRREAQAGFELALMDAKMRPCALCRGC